MLIVALVLAVIGLAALVTAVVTSNELIAWVCIGASVLGVLLLIVDAVRERSGDTTESPEGDEFEDDGTETDTLEPAEDYPEDADTADTAVTEVTDVTEAEPTEAAAVTGTGETETIERIESSEADSGKKD